MEIGTLTEVAVWLVGGSTLHSMLELPVQKDRVIVSMPLLTGNYLKGKMLIASINVFLFGDLMQLPPVQRHQVFQQPEHMKPDKYLWQQFSLEFN